MRPYVKSCMIGRSMVQLALRSLSQIVPSFTNARTALSARVTTFRVYELINFSVAVILLRHQRERKLSLRAVTSLHNFADAETAVLSWNVRLLAISRWFHRGKCWRRLVLQ